MSSDSLNNAYNTTKMINTELYYEEYHYGRMNQTNSPFNKWLRVTSHQLYLTLLTHKHTCTKRVLSQNTILQQLQSLKYQVQNKTID